MEALPFLQGHVVCMYTLLPAMKGITATMLLQALEEMKQYYSKPKLGDHLVRFQKILRRSTTISAQDRTIVEATLKTYEYDSLMDDSPKVLEGVMKGEVQGVQKMVIEAVEDKYPSLVGLAQEKVLLIQQPDLLRQLVKQIYHSPDEQTARWLLSTFTGQ